MMEIYQIVLMVIGAITVTYLFYKTVKGVFLLLDSGLASCFREKYPYDFERNLSWIVSELKMKGYRQAATMDAGSEYPGLMMKHPETGTEIEVRLRAPLFTTKGNSIIVVNHAYNTAIVLQDSASEENKILLKKYFD
jgi:hypothetical protein